MMYWNVTYNDPNRWKAVYEASGGRLPWWRGVREKLMPVRSDRSALNSCNSVIPSTRTRSNLGEPTGKPAKVSRTPRHHGSRPPLAS